MDDSYFTAMYATDPDPWGFDDRFYEHRKYDLTLAALCKPRYRSAFEPGCANGALTERLAARCDRLVAYDFVADAAERARQRMSEHDHVVVRSGRFPNEWPDGPLDLVVWSEIAYYLTIDQLDDAIDTAASRLDADGELVVVNYTGDTNYPLIARDVADRIDHHGSFRRRCGFRDESFRLDVWSPTS